MMRGSIENWLRYLGVLNLGVLTLSVVTFFSTATTARAQLSLDVVVDAVVAEGGDGGGSGSALTTVDGTGLGGGFPLFPDSHTGNNGHGVLFGGRTGSVHYDFGVPLDIQMIRVWNYNGGSVEDQIGIGRGAKSTELFGSDDRLAFDDNEHSSWTSILAFDVAKADAAAVAGEPYGQQIDIPDVKYQFLKLQIFDNWSFFESGGDEENSSGNTGLAEIQFLGTSPTPGDFNNDGDINENDYAVLRDNLQKQLGGGPVSFFDGDINVDGKVDLNDFRLFRVEFEKHNGMGSFAAITQVPEPSSVALLLCGLAGTVAVARRRGSLTVNDERLLR